MESSTEISYPRLIRRIQALLIDGLVLPVAVLGSVVVAAHFDGTGGYAVFFSGLMIFVLGPALVSFTGGTVGHHLRGLRVIHPRSKKHLNVLSATLRFVFKILLGWLSLITYFTTKRYQSIHDLVSNSVVTLRHPLKELSFEKRDERKFQVQGYRYPSAWKKVVVVVFYNVLFSAFTLLIFALIVNFSYSSMSPGLITFSLIFGVFWKIGILVFFAVSIYFCRFGRLFGCRRKPIREQLGPE